MAKRAFLTFLIAAILTSLCACGQSAPTWQEQYDLGVRYLSESNYDEAIIAFTAAIEIDPKQAPAYVGRGDAYSGMAWMLAKESVDAALSAEMVARYESAIADYLAALDLNESAVEVYRKAAETYVALRNMEAAREILKQGIDMTGDDGLQAYLDKLTEDESLFVLTQKVTYGKGPSIPYHANFVYEHADYVYDELGFQVGLNIWNVYDDGSENCWYSATWTYDENSKTWLEEKNRGTQKETNILNKRRPGTYDYIAGENFAGGYVHEGSSGSDLPIEGYTVNYTYDEHGNIARIDTYGSSGELTGYCLLTWEEIYPAVRRDIP